ncbi:hypothetical protein LYSIN_01425 [Lysinibacillus sphaericus]|uniref:Uncharacterized protein n=1 Tax=Lysinibacillus sphaericus TaxID=1421 RepID=A0A2S5D0W7_LYSSH|nr:DUF948 domain-containing protein [Lysinibacillus sphaericus]POZ56642.1 hypothetical protein LYSIN_01425 [Lysinibacillus sphaericus]
MGEFFIAIVFLVLIVGILITLKKIRSTNYSSTNQSRSNYSGNNTTDFISSGSVFSLQDTDRNDCSDTTSSTSDSGGSSCD